MLKRIAVLTALTLAFALPALAHVGIAPRESKPGAKETYTLRVPTEGQVAKGSASEYSLKAKMGARDVDSGGLETLVLVQDAAGAWTIRHSHTSARRRAPAAGGAQE